jgi:hypothetical protein
VAEKDYYSFEEVLRNLKLEEEQLKRLVSAGEIRAFRDKDTMRFKAEDVDRLKGGTTDELVLDDDLDLDLEAPPATVKVARPAGKVVEIDLEPGDELVLDESAPAAAVEELDLGGDAGADVEELPRAGRARAATTTTTRRVARVAAPEEDVKDGVGTIAMLVVGFAILLGANFVVLDVLAGRASNPISRAIANLF